MHHIQYFCNMIWFIKKLVLYYNVVKLRKWKRTFERNNEFERTITRRGETRNPASHTEILWKTFIWNYNHNTWSLYGTVMMVGWLKITIIPRRLKTSTSAPNGLVDGQLNPFHLLLPMLNHVVKWNKILSFTMKILCGF